MLNIIADIISFLGISGIVYNVFPGQSSEEIICVVEPSTANETVYLDGSIQGVVNFAFKIKSMSQQTADDTLKAIAEKLNFAEPFELSAGIFVKVEQTTVPLLVSVRDSGEYIFSCSFKVEYNKGV